MCCDVCGGGELYFFCASHYIFYLFRKKLKSKIFGEHLWDTEKIWSKSLKMLVKNGRILVAKFFLQQICRTPISPV